MRPTLSPNMELARKISATLLALYNKNHAIDDGMFTIIIARRRPK